MFSELLRSEKTYTWFEFWMVAGTKKKEDRRGVAVSIHKSGKHLCNSILGNDR